MSIETIISKCKDAWLETTVRLSENPFYKYSVDVTSGWLYYTLMYGAQEYVAGKDVDTIIKTRAIGLVAQAIALRPVGKLRNYTAKKWGVTKESSTKDKIKVNFISTTPIQSAMYSGMIIGGMAWSGHWDWKSSGIALFLGIVLSTVHSFPYGYVQDGARKFFGIKPAIGKKEYTPDQNYIAQ